MTTASSNRIFKVSSFSIWSSICCLILLLIAFRQAETALFAAWQTEEYSHGFLIPVIAAMMALHLLAIKRPEINPSWSGIGFIIIAILLQIITSLSAFGTTAQYGLIFGLTGLVVANFGKKTAYIIAPALAYLIFAIPLPHLFQANLSQGLQLLSSNIGVRLLDSIGIPVFQQGNVIDLGTYRLQVVEACSGLRYLFPLMSFGYLVAVLLEDSLWKRILLFLSTIPISIGMNVLRITIIGVTVDKWGIEMAEGFIHTFEGWTVFIICLALLMIETWILLHVGNRGRFRYDYVGLSRGPYFSAQTSRKSPAIAALILMVFFTGITFVERNNHIKEIIPSPPPFSSFPLQLGEWQGKRDVIPPDVLAALRPSDYWLANYTHPNDKNFINFYVAYYNSQREGITTHSPSNCLPGDGWEISNSHIVPITLANGEVIRVTRLLIHKGQDSQLVYYWFNERGRNLTETYYAKWYLLWDSLTMNRTDGALIRLITPLSEPSAEQQGDSRLKAFMEKALPVVNRYIPGAEINKNATMP